MAVKGWNFQHLNFVCLYNPRSPILQLSRGQIQYKCYFVTLGELGAMEAIRPDFLRKDILVHDSEAHVLKEFIFIGQGKYLFDAQLPGFVNARLYEQASDPPLVVGRRHGQGSDFRKVFPNDVQTAAPCDLIGLPIHIDVHVTQVRIELAQGTGQEPSIPGKLAQHLLYGGHIGNFRFTYHDSEPSHERGRKHSPPFIAWTAPSPVADRLTVMNTSVFAPINKIRPAPLCKRGETPCFPLLYDNAVAKAFHRSL
jgi:hypothetical protein